MFTETGAKFERSHSDSDRENSHENDYLLNNGSEQVTIFFCCKENTPKKKQINSL